MVQERLAVAEGDSVAEGEDEKEGDALGLGPEGEQVPVDEAVRVSV